MVRRGAPADVSTGVNQSPPLDGYDLFAENRPLAEALEREGAGWAAERASAFGTFLTGEPLEWGRLANENPPRLRTHDRFGNRIDEVEFHPAWHSLLGTSVEHGLHALSWREPREGAHVARATLFYLMAQVEAGHGCPVSMTHAAVPALRAQPELAAEWEPLLTSLDYDPGLKPVGREARRALRHGDDRAAGRLRRSREHHRRAVARRRRVRARRAQVVLLRADVRRVPRARAGGRRALVLPRPARAAGRDAQRLPHPAVEGQARRPLERVERDRARVRVGAARRRGGTRRADDHRDGQPHASRLRARHGGGDAHGRRAGDAPRRAPLGVRQAARRPAADEQRPRRPVRRVRGGDADRAAARARVRPRARPTSPASPPRSRSTGSASAVPATRPRRSSASAATATSRSRCCRACTASSRCSRSGKGRAT